MIASLSSNIRFILVRWGLCSCTINALIGNASGFVSFRSRIRIPSPSSSATTLHSTNPNYYDEVNSPLGGVATFEEWFSSHSSAGARINNIRHALFHSTTLRGLEFTSAKSSDLNRVAVVPRKLVMSVPYSEQEGSREDGAWKDERSWDVNLSCKLWEECQKGRESMYYG